MTMSKMVVNLARTPDKWLRLMLHFQNSIPTIFRITMPDKESAKFVRARLDHVQVRQPTWFNMLVILRGCDVFVVKLDRVQEVVIKDELPQL